MNNNKDKIVLNIGSGGELEAIIRDKFENIFSVDVDEKRNPDQVLDICDENFSKKIKIKPSLVCCFEVLEHTKDPCKAINNIYSIFYIIHLFRLLLFPDFFPFPFRTTRSRSTQPCSPSSSSDNHIASPVSLL